MKGRHWSILALVWSCGGSSVGDNPVDTTPQGVCAFYAERDCAALERCDPNTLSYVYNDVVLCKERSARSCLSRLTATGTSETAARRIDCAKAIAGLACENYLDFERWPEPCAIGPGTLADGAACIAAAQCQGGSCSMSSGEGCGVCRTVSRQGGACTVPDDCFDAIPCLDGVCTLNPRLGEPCRPGVLDCISGLVCAALDMEGTGSCEKLRAEGSACDPFAPGGVECDYLHGLFCDDGTCRPGAASPRIGEACTDSCNAVSYCDGAVCMAKPREGEACSTDVGCLTPARCTDGTCIIRDASVCQ